jgi:hypothetical protein
MLRCFRWESEKECGVVYTEPGVNGHGLVQIGGIGSFVLS